MVTFMGLSSKYHCLGHPMMRGSTDVPVFSWHLTGLSVDRSGSPGQRAVQPQRSSGLL
ncbi:hypothetical protein MPL1032_250088 [Mesorhizobium plurifarium]|uniref:Uncharacterized protein n=1 Tax=Mesorhizobium plurifarium TaxID=69974 RepID=A0A0K2W1W2_MESPL|nr:hypothetical protein MPL1032_250088 [Mesorhizobium plurifarium]